LDRAINGYAGQTGYKLEYRFHFFLGRIRLGSSRNNSPEIIRLAEAERAFLYAARYATREIPKEVARALLAAGWAAYCREDMNLAQQHTQQAVTWDAGLGEAHFQLAKILIDEPAQALVSLQTAIEIAIGLHAESNLGWRFQKVRMAGFRVVGSTAT